jgi:hypothetical protein
MDDVEAIELRRYIKALRFVIVKARDAATRPKCPADGPAALKLFATIIESGLADFEAKDR